MKQYPVSLGSKIDRNIVDSHISPGLVNQPVCSSTGAVCQKKVRGWRDCRKSRMLEPKICLCLHRKFKKVQSKPRKIMKW